MLYIYCPCRSACRTGRKEGQIICRQMARSPVCHYNTNESESKFFIFTVEEFAAVKEDTGKIHPSEKHGGRTLISFQKVSIIRRKSFRQHI